MKTEFFDRTLEMDLLKKKYAELASGRLLVIYGRRRVGKTELVKEFLNRLPPKDKFYFYVNLGSKQEVLNTLSLALQEQLKENIKFTSFDQFLEYIEQKSKLTKFLLVIDEFQRFLSIAPEFITKLQHFWDSKLKNQPIMILLVGSSIGMMQRITESRAGALYGRVLKMKISPFRYVDFRLMFKNLSEKEKIERFSVFGGTPYYLEKTKNISSTLEAINELVIKKGAELSEEPKNLMEYENVRAHAKYNSILSSLSAGKEILKEIQDFTKIPLTTLPTYLQKLDELLDLVGKRDPLLGKERLGRYCIKDNFFRFWYKFIYPHQTALNLGNEKYVLQIIENELNSYIGHIFEDIIKELLILYLNQKIKGVEINFTDIGGWWDRNSHEIDVVAYNQKERKILLGEVKWTNQPMDIDIFEQLLEKAKFLNFSGEYQYLLVCKNGFTPRCLAKIQEFKVLHLDLEEIAQLFDKLS